ncbi:MAG: transposase [Hymenobacteraceae bacterium]|nr:transposase [Hymenobacteraceae bacterium]
MPVADTLLPVGLHLVVKQPQAPRADGTPVWKAPQTKNEAFRELLHQAHQNTIPFSYVLADSWYTNADNIRAVRAIGKHGLGAVKSNLEVAPSSADRANGRFVPIRRLSLAVGAPHRVPARAQEARAGVRRQTTQQGWFSR